MIYVEINETRYPATISGSLCDRNWENRESKSITITATYEEAMAIFKDDIKWNIVIEDIVDNELVTESYDNSEYSVLGDIIMHRDGTVTVKMGKPTDLETAYELLYGGES